MLLSGIFSVRLSKFHQKQRIDISFRGVNALILKFAGILMSIADGGLCLI